MSNNYSKLFICVQFVVSLAFHVFADSIDGSQFEKLKADIVSKIANNLKIKPSEVINQFGADEISNFVFEVVEDQLEQDSEIFDHDESIMFKAQTGKEPNITNVFKAITLTSSVQETRNSVLAGLRMIYSSNIPKKQVIPAIQRCVALNREDYFVLLECASIFDKYGEKQAAVNLMRTILLHSGTPDYGKAEAAIALLKYDEVDGYDYIMDALKEGRLITYAKPFLPFHGRLTGGGKVVDAELLLRCVYEATESVRDSIIREEIRTYEKLRTARPDLKLRPAAEVCRQVEEKKLRERWLKRVEVLTDAVRGEISEWKFDIWLGVSALSGESSRKTSKHEPGNQVSEATAIEQKLVTAKEKLYEAYVCKNLEVVKERLRELSNARREAGVSENLLVQVLMDIGEIFFYLDEYTKAEVLFDLLTEQNGPLPYEPEAQLEKAKCLVAREGKRAFPEALSLAERAVSETVRMPPEIHSRILIKAAWLADACEDSDMAKKLLAKGLKEFESDRDMERMFRQNIKDITRGAEGSEYQEKVNREN